jgi:serine-type D-Ala-D-Ala carboxypeptidase (penicillin-binding protein 5/6)
MQPSSAVKLVCSVLLAVGGLASARFAHAWVSSSQSFGSDQVLGASTDGGTTVQLQQYGKLTGTPPNLLVKQYALYSAETGQVLIKGGQVAEGPVPMASTTKLMTALITLQSGLPLDQVATVSERAAAYKGSILGVKPGDQLTVRELLDALLIVSANDAGQQLAETLGRFIAKNDQLTGDAAVAVTVATMNRTARQLSLTDTSYADPVGLENATVSSAVDLAKLMAVIMQQPLLVEMMATRSMQVTERSSAGRVFNLRNTNDLLGVYPGMLGGKTGYTEAAGRCLVAATRRDGQTFISVILGADPYELRAYSRATSQLLDYGFANVVWE